VPCGDPEALIEAAVMLATDDLLRAQLRASARAAVEAQSWEQVIAAFEAELEAVVASRPAEPAFA
jgi:glycosyltransferase involved in cell wall biosynthesis